ncbi:Hsp20/alpha crystallin family protein [Candidatus Peregrinibacteria bacterium]|nr:Hsp20/alpha crystallin family protein [Candidatus Peregrinibacteria bacterium]
MTQSPFHGIFGSLGDSAAKGKVQTKQGSPIPPPASTAGRVAVDIYEQDDYYIIKAPIAGVRLSDIDIEVNDNVITIKGRRHQGDGNIPADQYYIQECFWGEFSRSVTLPTAIDPRKVKATLNKECILKVLVPKEDRVKVVRINEV